MAGSEAIGPCALYYEQFEIGAHWRSPSRTLTETDALMFAALSGDLESLCFDATAPANSGGRRISGPCALALATGLEQRLGLKEGTGIAFLGATWVCHRPLYAADTVRVEQRVRSMRVTRNAERGIVAFDVRLVSHRDDTLYSGVWTLLMRRNSALSSRAGGNQGRVEAAADISAAAAAGSTGAMPEFRIGESWTTPRRTVTETDIAQFCALTGDYNPAHSDAEFARTSPFGERILQGPAGLAVAHGLYSRLDAGRSVGPQMGAVNWVFKEPILMRDTLRAVLTVKAMPSPHSVLLDAVVLNQHDKIVHQGEWTMVAR